MAENDTLNKTVQYDEVDHKINKILEILFHDYKISKKKVRVFQKLIGTFVNQITINAGKITNQEISQKEYDRMRIDYLDPLFSYLAKLVDEKLLTREQCIVITEEHLIYVEVAINENIVKSYNKWTLEESISRKWQ